MEWERVIERNREGLRRVLVLLLALAGLDGGAAPAPSFLMPRRAHRAVLRLLRPAESAARRLIVVAARALSLPPLPARPAPVLQGRQRAKRPIRLRAFALFDRPSRQGPPRLPSSRDMPRITFFGADSRPPAPLRPPCLPDDLLDARRLAARLAALSAVLDDLPRAARRFSRWAARTSASSASPRRTPSGRRRLSPFRVGRPPGQRRHGRGEVHDILSDLHFFAVEALAPPDTS